MRRGSRNKRWMTLMLAIRPKRRRRSHRGGEEGQALSQTVVNRLPRGHLRRIRRKMRMRLWRITSPGPRWPSGSLWEAQQATCWLASSRRRPLSCLTISRLPGDRDNRLSVNSSQDRVVGQGRAPAPRTTIAKRSLRAVLAPFLLR